MTPPPLAIAALVLCLLVSPVARTAEVTLEFDTLPVSPALFPVAMSNLWNGVGEVEFVVDSVHFLIQGGLGEVDHLYVADERGNPTGQLACGNEPDTCGVYHVTLDALIDFVKVDFHGVGGDAGYPDDLAIFSLEAGGLSELLTRDCRTEVCDRPASLELDLQGRGLQSFSIAAAAYFLQPRPEVNGELAEHFAKNLARIERITVRTIPEPSPLWLMALGLLLWRPARRAPRPPPPR